MKRLAVMMAMMCAMGCGGSDEVACPDGPLGAADAPCACGEDGTFDPDPDYVDGTCECGFEDNMLDCSGGDTEDTDAT